MAEPEVDPKQGYLFDALFVRLENRSRLMTLEENTWRYIKGRLIVTQPLR